MSVFAQNKNCGKCGSYLATGATNKLNKNITLCLWTLDWQGQSVETNIKVNDFAQNAMAVRLWKK